MMSEGNDPLPPFRIHSLRRASVLWAAAGFGAPNGRSPSGPRGLPAPVRPAGSPQRTPKLGLGQAPPAGTGPAALLHPAPLDVGAEPGVQRPSLKRPRGARKPPGPSGRGCAAPAIAFWDRKAPSDRGLIANTPLFLLEQVNVRAGRRGPGRGHVCPRHQDSPRLSGSSYAIKLIYCDCSSLL